MKVIPDMRRAYQIRYLRFFIKVIYLFATLFVVYSTIHTFTIMVFVQTVSYFPLIDNTDGAAVYQVQQQHLFISKLHRLTLG